jgi:3-dehydroquinate dehydratase II
MNNVLVLHGPNLNLLGLREHSIYGLISLTQINEQLTYHAKTANLTLTTRQSNHEGEMIDAIHEAARDNVSHIIINPAAYTHTSIAIRDAFLAVSIPFIEVHISNIHAREDYRHHSYLSDIALGVISGLGTNGYLLALQAIIWTLKQNQDQQPVDASTN